MNVKSRDLPESWVDPEDAPELSDAFFEKAEYRIGEQVVPPEQGRQAMQKALSRGRPKAAQTKLALTVRYDADIVAAFKASGKGWQTRMNEALRDWLKKHSPV